MSRFVHSFAVLLACITAGFAPAADAPERVEKQRQPEFIRVLEKDSAPIALQTSIARYVSPKGTVEVDLVGVIHIGDKRYYELLNKRFKGYDVVLYELVAEPDRRVPLRGRNSGNPLAMIQELMTDVLGLSHQLKVVDYKAANFVHADLSPSEMKKALADRGEDQLTMLLGVVVDMFRKQNKERGSGAATEMQSLQQQLEQMRNVLTDRDGSRKMKRMFARQLGKPGAMGDSLPKVLETLIVKDRNAKALEIFDTELKRLQDAREKADSTKKVKVAIFYGAAHNPDFHSRLTSRYGLRHTGEEWLDAWDMRAPDRMSPANRLLFKALEKLLEQDE